MEQSEQISLQLHRLANCGECSLFPWYCSHSENPVRLRSHIKIGVPVPRLNFRSKPDVWRGNKRQLGQEQITLY